MLHRFATWYQLRNFGPKPAKEGPLGNSPAYPARQQLIQAGSFLTWLTVRGALTLSGYAPGDHSR